MRGKQRVKYKATHTRLSTDLSTETLQAKGEYTIFWKIWKGKFCNLGYSNQKDYHLEQKDKLKNSQTSKKMNTAIPNLS